MVQETHPFDRQLPRENALDHGQHLWFEGERPTQNAAPSDDVYVREGDDVVTAQRSQPLAGSDYEGYTVNAFPVVGSGATNVALPSLLLSHDVNRRKAVIRNSGADPVRIGKLGQVSAGAGYLLPANAELNAVEVSAEVYVATDVAKQTVNPVSVWCEYNR